jgi:hypothetical protein
MAQFAAVGEVLGVDVGSVGWATDGLVVVF